MNDDIASGADQVRPRLNVLTAAQREQVHGYALEILSRIGIKVDAETVRARFKAGGCRVSDENRVRIPAEAVDRALASAPGAVSLYRRDGEPAFTLGGGPERFTRFGVGVTNLYYQDPMTDAVAPFRLDHVATSTRLGHALSEFDVVSTPGVARDFPEETADLHTCLAMAANTTLPLILLISETRLVTPSLDLLDALFGRDPEKPFAALYVNPITPLVLNTETADKMTAAIERGMPVIYSNYGMSGATAPITPGGTLALLTAELLAGLVFSQLLKPGAPIILGSLPAGFDMRTMTSLYTPHTMLLNAACAEMMAHYGLPHAGTSGSGPGWGADLPAAGAFWMNHLASILGQVDLAPFVGGNFDSMAFSPAAVVYANEVIRQSRLFGQGFSLDAEAVHLDEIEQLGPGGNFLMAPSTCRMFRSLPYASPFWPSLTLEQWEAKGGPKADAMFRAHVRDLLAELTPPPDHDDVLAKGRAWIHAHFNKS